MSIPKAAARYSAQATLRKVPFPYRAPTVPRGAVLPKKDPTLGVHYDTEWARSWPARIARYAIVETALRGAVGLLADPKVAGADRLDGLDGPVVFVANHHSHLDTPVLLTAIPEPWRHRMFVGAAADYFFSGHVQAVASALAIGAVPIERSKVSRTSAKRAAELIDDGWSMLIFPEGGRSPDGWGQDFRPGAAWLASRCGVPVVPIHLEGTGRILRKGRTVPSPATVRITFGHALTPHADDDARTFSDRLEKAVQALADESATDWWQARRRAHAGDSPTLAGPDTGAWRRAWQLSGKDPRRARAPRRWPDLG